MYREFTLFNSQILERAVPMSQKAHELALIFPDHDISVIQMALEASSFSSERASVMLLEMATGSSNGKQQTTPASSVTTTTTNITTTTTTSTTTNSEKSVLPTNFLLLPGMKNYVLNASSTITSSASRRASGKINDGGMITSNVATPSNQKKNIENSTQAPETSTNTEQNDVDDDDDDDDDDGGLLLRP